MAINVGINGFGRIGRLVFRRMMETPEKFNVVGINDLSNPKDLAILLKYDSTHGRFKGGEVTNDDANLIVNGKKIPITAEKNPADIPWAKLGADVVLLRNKRDLGAPGKQLLGKEPFLQHPRPPQIPEK